MMETLKTLASVPQVLAIGECGLDRRKGPPLSVQMPCWEAQFSLAQELQLPLILHCVRSWQNLLPLCRLSGVPMLFHDFRGNSSVLEAFLPFPQIYFSFGKNLMKSGKSQEVFCKVPESRFLLETDNSLLKIESLYQKAAGLKQLNPDNFKNLMKKNTAAFFGERALAFF
jgi:TatD DNase family protein